MLRPRTVLPRRAMPGRVFRCSRRPFAALALLLAAVVPAGADEWPQFGGPDRDFVAPSPTLGCWSRAEGPKVVWRRPLGEGYSSVAVAGGRLYTMLREGDDEIVLALDAGSGEEIWRHAYRAPIPEYMERDRGLGPHGTPLVTEDRVFVTGVRGTLLALERWTGRALWRRELVDELGGTTDIRGYPASPLAVGELVVLPVGGDGQSVVAFRQEDGGLAWSAGDFANSMSSADLIEVNGERQVVALLDGVVAGFDAAGGRLLWWREQAPQRGQRNIVMPLWDGKALFVSTQHGGSQLLEVGGSGAPAAWERRWHTNEVRFHFTSIVRRGDVVYGSSGDFGPVPLTALDLGNGEVLWRDRSFVRANLVAVGERVLLLDEDGELALVSFSPERLEIHCRHPLVDELAWTPPTVVGDRVYVRTRTQLLALELPSS